MDKYDLKAALRFVLDWVFREAAEEIHVGKSSSEMGSSTATSDQGEDQNGNEGEDQNGNGNGNEDGNEDDDDTDEDMMMERDDGSETAMGMKGEDIVYLCAAAYVLGLCEWFSRFSFELMRRYAGSFKKLLDDEVVNRILPAKLFGKFHSFLLAFQFFCPSISACSFHLVWAMFLLTDFWFLL